MIKNVSLKKNLIVTLSSLISVALVIIFLVGFVAAKSEISEVFDANLVKSAKLIFGLIKHEIFEEKDNDFELDLTEVEKEKLFHRYEYKIHSQIWSGDKLIYNSSKNHLMPKPDYEGFKDIDVDEIGWRVFVFYDVKLNVTILIMEKESIRNKLTDEILFSLFLPLLFSFVPLLIIIVVTINKRLKPVENIADRISKMSSKNLEKFVDLDTPLELKPFIQSFNSLVEKLNDSMESERRFTDYAAHELKTPLAAIMIQAQLLLKNKNQNRQEEYLNDLIKGIERMSHMINQLLTLTRLEPENKAIEKEDCDLKNLLQSLLKNYSTPIFQKNIEVKFDDESSAEKFVIHANKTYIEIMISNMIDNAIKYSPENGLIKIDLWLQNKLVNLRISNRGMEISDEDQKKVFNNFYRVQNSKSEENPGCGLGLAIVKKISDLHGGTTSFTSQDGINSIEVHFS